MTDRVIYTLTGHVNPTDLLTLADGQAVFAPIGAGGAWGSITGTISSQTDLNTALNNRPAVVTPQQYGAVADGVTDDSAAFVAAIAALKAYALNAGGGLYKGSPKLFIPAGHYYLGTTTLDINHTLIIEGEGSGRAPAPGYGCTLLRWADGVCGIRTQFVNTSGTTTVDGVSHDGVGSCYIKNISMEGGYVATNGASHAIVVRAITFLDDVLIRNWSGTGVLTWTGNVLGTGYGGQTSVSRYTGIKVENCLIAFDTRGTDSNVIKIANCEAYQCRQAGFIDNNGAGSNTYDTCHATFNGLSSTSLFTQVTYSSQYYALIWGQETGAATNAPSGTTADNTWWAYVGAGSVDSVHPAWVSGMSGLIGGGDYVMLSAFPTMLFNCYMEGGGFSQLGVGTLGFGGTNLGISAIGGTCLVPEFDALALKRLHAASTIHLDGSLGAANGIDSRDSTGLVGGASWNNQGGYYVAKVASGHLFYSLAAGVQTNIGSWSTAGINISTGLVYSVNGIQVVAARQTGWTADTGTAKKTANATYAAGTTLTYSATYVQSEQTAMATRVAALEAVIQSNSQTIKALKDALIAHGLIGA